MLHDITIAQFSKMLQNLGAMLERARAHADQKKFDVDVLLHARLAPDQFHFIRQVQIACDTAKLGASRLTGKPAPSHPDDEKTLDDLQKRIQETLAFLESVKPADFDGASERHVSQPRWAGKYLTGQEFALQHMVPNFYFHVTTAYSILRHNGVELGKKDYLGAMPFKGG
jgi:hypothetical protein